MLKKVKDLVRRWLFRDEQLEYEARLLAYKSMKDSASIVALAREQLAGFDPKTISLEKVRNAGSLSIFDELTEDEQVTLMSNVHQLYTNPALKIITDFLTRQQVLHGQMEADSLLGLNFSRATVNGLMLLWDVINEVEGLYKAKKQAPEEFDPHNVL